MSFLERAFQALVIIAKKISRKYD